MNEKKIVFINIVGGGRHDMPKLMGMLNKVAKDTEFNFIVAPPGKEIQSISIKQLRELIKQVEDDNPTTNSESGEESGAVAEQPENLNESANRDSTKNGQCDEGHE